MARHPAKATVVGWIGNAACLLLGVLLIIAFELALGRLELGADLPRGRLAGFSRRAPAFERTEGFDGSLRYRLWDTRDSPEPVEFAARKPERGFRIFVVGGSSAAGVPYGHRLSFSGWLDDRLRAELPGVQVEVVNAAASGFATRRLLVRVRELARYEPDLLIVYSGHNEIAERRFYERFVRMDPRLFWLWEAAAATRLYTLLGSLLGRASGEPGVPVLGHANHAAQMFAARRGSDLPPPAFLQSVERDYHDRIEAMIHVMQDAGARVMLLSLSQNFADWEPGASSHRPGLGAEESARFQAHDAQGDRLATSDCAAALETWERARRIDDQLAMLHFKMGRCQRSLGHLSEAARSYRRASDLDRIPYGAPTRYNEILRELAARHGALFVDVAARLDRESLGGLVGDDLFADPMHPNLRAHRVIAAAVAQALQAHGLPAPAKQWQPGRYREPDLAAVYEADSELRRRERLIRALTCLLAERPACVRAEAEAVLADQPEDPTARAFLRDLSRPGGRQPRFRE